MGELQEEVARLSSILESIHMETSKAKEAIQLQRAAVTPPEEEDMAQSQVGHWLLVTSGIRQCSTPTPNHPPW